MTILRSSPSSLSIASSFFHCPVCSTLLKPPILSQIMDSSSKPCPVSISSAAASSTATRTVPHQVPNLNPLEMERTADQIFRRYSSSDSKRSGEGVAIVWFRNDLRVLDNEALYAAWISSRALLPVYCVDPRLFGTTHYFGFPKTGALRAQFLIECLDDLKKNLMKRGLNLLIQHGKPEEILPLLAKSFGAHTVYAHKETCIEELTVERLVSSGLHQVLLPRPCPVGLSTGSSCRNNSKLHLTWGSTMYHVDDLPFDTSRLPDVYTQFRKSVEAKCTIRGCIKVPGSLGPPPDVGDWGSVPSIDQLGLHPEKISKGMRFVGGESAALSRVNEYFWKNDLLRIYKETRNGMLGPDYSTKFSPWLASGSLSPRFICEEVKRYEKEHQANDSTYCGPRKVKAKWSQDQALFESWRNGCTGYPLIDANMKELLSTGFMSNRGRQIVCSFLVRDMGIDWRMGAEWFETCLLDYDPCSNYGNWTYGAGVGNDPREDRYFSIPKQAQTYDPEGEYVAYWLPELQVLPKEKRHFPGIQYLKQIVPLKFGNNYRQGSQDFVARRTKFRGRHMVGR
ncbi:cryptochrome DASH, chloroplastic/mitochondrial isoform X2 [Malania oleifera]|uniref:cryptochrome DASH, chloroplastic/mitochondrial isoform X2 n=1 Tax=Malania oleifera TaxID=397392 RepID=UPI0025ADE134|nr:cryptochrome DASH, chloroplastic/mitochondrial isoform X2 [Malania oleifera]